MDVLSLEFPSRLLERVRQEFDEVLGDAPLGHADVPKLVFSTQVIQEALRLYPPFWMIDREAIADDRVGDISIPAGSMVIVNVYGAHHAPKHWPDAEAFDTDRFIKGNDKLRAPLPTCHSEADPELHWQSLCHAADTHDHERPAEKVRLRDRARSNDRGSPMSSCDRNTASA